MDNRSVSSLLEGQTLHWCLTWTNGLDYAYKECGDGLNLIDQLSFIQGTIESQIL